MQNIRRYSFSADDSVVFVGLLPNGMYGARLDGDDLIRGMGHTRLAAIADLNDALEKLESIHEREPYRIEVAEAAE